MSPTLRSATAAVGRALQSRRILHRRPFSNGNGQEIGDEVKRAKIWRHLEELDTKLQREIAEEAEKVKRMQNEDRTSLDRLLTSCGVPKGAIRNKLFWGCNVAAMFLASSAAGAWMTERDARRVSWLF